ncbi:TIGR03749 family integrating conjugative element protein [Aeromonas caviae]|uniref:TIGR03749 family integrating conjugative element protein n=1 Tax=Aeromonas caviae TaxID=648 RepID=UPI003EC818D2
MKHPVLVLLGLLAAAAAPVSHAVEILRWERMPLAVPLKVGQERIVFIDRNVRVGVPAGVGERLRVQSAGGAVYLRASEPIEPTRLQLQDADTGALILLDIAAEPPKDGEAELEPVRIVEGSSTPARYGDQAGGADEAPARSQDETGTRAARRETPVSVVLTRFAAQNLYAPLRTVEPLPGVMRVNLRRDLDLGTLMPTLPVRAVALASWRLEDQWVTAVRLTNSSGGWVTLDPRVLQGDFLTATFQHEALGPRGRPRTRPSCTW